MTSDRTHEPSPSRQDEVVEVRVRRAPKVGVFLALGAALGIVAALVLTFGFNGTATPDPTTGIQYTSGQVFGYLLLFCIPIGLVIGGVVAVILDRTVGNRTRTVTVDHETHTGPDATA